MIYYLFMIDFCYFTNISALVSNRITTLCQLLTLWRKTNTGLRVLIAPARRAGIYKK